MVARRGTEVPASSWRIVTTPTAAASASCCWLQSNSPLAALHCSAEKHAPFMRQEQKFDNYIENNLIKRKISNKDA